MEKRNRLFWLQTVAKGFLIGITMLVPGVSGGSMAMLLGIYDRLVLAVSTFRKEWKKNLLFLAAFSIPALLGMVLFAAPLLRLVMTYPKPVMYFFMGAAAGGIPSVLKHAAVHSWKLTYLLYMLLGILGVCGLQLLPQGHFSGNAGYLWQVAGGFLAAVALVLPGISVSWLLLLLGLYEPVMRAVSALDLVRLCPLGAGLLLGIALTTRMLAAWMQRFRQASHLVILGFLLGSAAMVFPGIPAGEEWLYCPLLAVLGFMAIRCVGEQ